MHRALDTSGRTHPRNPTTDTRTTRPIELDAVERRVAGQSRIEGERMHERALPQAHGIVLQRIQPARVGRILHRTPRERVVLVTRASHDASSAWPHWKSRSTTRRALAVMRDGADPGR